MREEKWIDFEKQARKQIREACARLVFFRDGNLGGQSRSAQEASIHS